MAMKFLAVQGFSYSISNSLVSATISLTGTPSTKGKAGNKGICKDGFTIVVTNIMVPSVGATIPDPGPYSTSFTAQAIKNKIEDTLVLRLDDKTDTINANPKIPGSPPTPYPVSFYISISDAGQDKVQGE